MKRLWIVLLVLLSSSCVWAQAEAEAEAEAEGSKVVLDLSFELQGQLGEKTLETRPRVRTFSGSECEIWIGPEPGEPAENVTLKVTPKLMTQGRVEIDCVFSLETGKRSFQRRVRLVTLLGVPATISFEEDNLQLELTVVPTIWVE